MIEHIVKYRYVATREMTQSENKEICNATKRVDASLRAAAGKRLFKLSN